MARAIAQSSQLTGMAKWTHETKSNTGRLCVPWRLCATADFTPYHGSQQNWPVASGAFIDNKHTVPVFYGTANRPYDVIGYLKAETDAFRNTQSQVIDFMAHRAREVGGNGLIVVGTGSHYLGSVSSGSVYGNVWPRIHGNKLRHINANVRRQRRRGGNQASLINAAQLVMTSPQRICARL
jgi:uncharacterized protein YbjQ (UPF0145 family)